MRVPGRLLQGQRLGSTSLHKTFVPQLRSAGLVRSLWLCLDISMATMLQP